MTKTDPETVAETDRQPAKVRCEGWRRYGGAFTLGTPQWERCENDATVMLTIHEPDARTIPACQVCLEEAEATYMQPLEHVPIAADVKP